VSNHIALPHHRACDLFDNTEKRRLRSRLKDISFEKQTDIRESVCVFVRERMKKTEAIEDVSAGSVIQKPSDEFSVTFRCGDVECRSLGVICSIKIDASKFPNLAEFRE
jgi:hypothetical protein